MTYIQLFEIVHKLLQEKSGSPAELEAAIGRLRCEAGDDPLIRALAHCAALLSTRHALLVHNTNPGHTPRSGEGQ